MADTIISMISYAGFDDCILMQSEDTEIIFTTQVGPRILCLRLRGSENLFFEAKGQLGRSNSDEYLIYGGHRLWHSPEAVPRTYQNDTAAVSYCIVDNHVTVTQAVEQKTGMLKEMEAWFGEDGGINVLHRLTNKGMWSVKTGIWALSMMAPSGVLVIPQSTKDTGLLPNRTLTLWSYSKLNDPRISFLENHIALRQDVCNTNRFKLGLPNYMGYAAYFINSQMLLLEHQHHEGALYEDSNSSLETFTNNLFLELETLGATSDVQPEQTIEHLERWHLFGNVEMPADETALTALLDEKRRPKR